MSSAPVEAEIVSPATPTLGDLLRGCARWLRHHLLQTILMALIGMAFGWLVNWYYLVMKYEGYDLPGDGRGGFAGSANLITGRGNVMWGSLAWGLATTIGFGVFGYWWSVGTERFLRELAGLPDRFARLFRQRGRQAWSAVLWGVAMSMLISLFISPWLGVVFAGAFFVSASSLVGRILSGLALRAWSSVMQSIAPTRRQRYDNGDAVILGMLGSAAALALTFLLPESIPGLRGLMLLAAIVGAVVLNIVPRSATPLILFVAVAAWLGDLLFPLEAWADDGGWVEAGGNFRNWAQSPGAGVVTTYAGTGGAAAGGGAAIGNAIGQVIGQQGSGPLVDPWSGKPLTPWEPGRFGPGENGEQGKPGQVWWGGNWMDPADVRERIEESLAADRRREAESRQFEEESRRLREQAQRDREEQAKAEAARQEAAREEAARRAAAIDRRSGDLTAQQREAVDRIMQGTDWSNPSPEDLERLRRLTGAVGNIQQGTSEREGAAAEADAANAQLGEDAARVVREIGQAAGETAEQILTGGTTRGAITNFIYGAAGAAGEGKGPGEAVANGLRDARDGVIMNVGFSALGRAGVPMPTGPLGQTLMGGAMGAGAAAWQGASGEDIIKEGLYGGLGAAASAGFENNAGVHTPHAPDDGSSPHPPTERKPGHGDDGATGHGDDGTKRPDSTPDRQRELEEAARLKAQDDLRRQHELEEQTRRQNEAEAERKRQQEAEAEHKRQEEAEAERKRQQEAEAERKRQEDERKRQDEAEAERKRQEEAEAERKRKDDAEAERKRQEEAEAERKRQEEAEAERKRQEEIEAERKRQEEAEAERKRQEEADAERKRQEEAEAERKRQEEAEAERKRQEEAEAERKRLEEAEAERKRKEDAEAERQRQENAEAERKRQEQAADERKRQESDEARARREKQAETQRRQQEEQRAAQEQQSKEQERKQLQQQQQAQHQGGVDMSTERLRQVNDHLDANPQDRKHNYINMDTKRLVDAKNAGALTPGLEPLVHATASGAGAAGYTFESTQVVRIPQEHTVAASRVKDGVFYDSKNRPIDPRTLADKIVTIPNEEGTGVNPFHVDGNGKSSRNIPTRYLERWDANSKSFVPV